MFGERFNKMAAVCIKMCSSMYQIPMRILCTFLVLLQGVVLDYYLVYYKNNYWCSWIVADVALLFTFFMAFVISYRHLILAKESAERNTPIQTGPLPLGYFAWFVYSCLLAARVAIIFKDIAFQLKEEDFFGPNTLKICISSAAFVFLFLLLSHHNAETDSLRKIFINELTGTVVFDVLDSVDVLDVLFNHKAIEDFPVHLDTAIISIACINLVLPTIPLMTLSKTHFGHKKAPREILFLHKMLLVFLVNLPLLIIRLLLWHVLSKEISVFPIKNLIVIFLVFYDMFEKRKEEIERDEREMDEFDGETSDLCRSKHRHNSGSISQGSYKHQRHTSGSFSQDDYRHRHGSGSLKQDDHHEEYSKHRHASGPVKHADHHHRNASWSPTHEEVFKYRHPSESLRQHDHHHHHHHGRHPSWSPTHEEDYNRQPSTGGHHHHRQPSWSPTHEEEDNRQSAGGSVQLDNQTPWQPHTSGSVSQEE